METIDNSKKIAAEQAKKWQSGIILISGRAWGKSHIGKLLEKDYKARGIPCRRRCCGEPWTLTEDDLQYAIDGFLIIETNIMRPEIAFIGLDIRQHIRLS
ncbi:hypothetical protein [uncultured Desulfobacter sp.]|uniref:hypothetical protein n=1 Tax=uncultured Desulfobacter sp. TaxID=240139 RepID=UPI0029F4FCB7|nr:hypothetical protein [uncultured Desulfobacter sp.]